MDELSIEWTLKIELTTELTIENEFHISLSSFQLELCWEIDIVSNVNIMLSSNNRDLRELSFFVGS